MNKQSQSGFTLVEVSIIVMTLAILSSILLPQMGVFMRDARMARAREDVAAIGVSLMQMLKDIGESQFYTKPMGDWRTPTRGSDNEVVPVGLLIGDGDTPDQCEHPDHWNWRVPFGSTVDSATTDFGGASLTAGVVDTFHNHLIHNNPTSNADERSSQSWRRYRTPADMAGGDHSSGVSGGLHFDPIGGQGFNSEFAWRGPYLDAVRPDPWGNRYMANVLWLTMPQDAAGSGFIRAVIVLSVGPDEQVDTDFSSPGGFVVGDDDIAYPVSYGSLR